MQRRSAHVRVTGFSHVQKRQVNSVLNRSYYSLQPGAQPRLKVKRQRSGGRRIGSTTYNPITKRSTVTVHPKVFNSRRYNPEGVLAHEVGHAAHFHRLRTDHRYATAYGKDFNWKVPRGTARHRPQHWKMQRENPTRGKRTRQSHDATEDFAETFRVSLGYSSPVKHRYYRTTTTPTREQHIRKHYLT